MTNRRFENTGSVNAHHLAPHPTCEFHGRDMLTDDPTIRVAEAHTTLISSGSEVVESVRVNDVRTEIQFDKSTNFLHCLSRSGVNSAPDDKAVEAYLVWNEDGVDNEQLNPSDLAAALCEGAGTADHNTVWGELVKFPRNASADAINKHAKTSADAVWPKLMAFVGSCYPHTIGITCWDLEFPVLGDSNMSPQSSVTKIVSFSFEGSGPPIISKPSVSKTLHGSWPNLIQELGDNGQWPACPQASQLSYKSTHTVTGCYWQSSGHPV